MTKRWRAPRAKAGELKAQWGKLKWDKPDLCYAWGEGCHKCDSHLLHGVLTMPPLEHDWDKESGLPWKYGKSFIKELEERGYDITTLRFSVQKKKTT